MYVHTHTKSTYCAARNENASAKAPPKKGNSRACGRLRKEATNRATLVPKQIPEKKDGNKTPSDMPTHPPIRVKMFKKAMEVSFGRNSGSRNV